MFSSRFHWDLSPNSLTLVVNDKRERGEDLIDLTESNPTRAGFAYPEGRITRAFAKPGMLTYDPQPRGLLQTRTLVADAYAARGRIVSPERIVLTASTSEAYAFLLKLLTDADDFILVPRPSYPLIEFLSGFERVQLAPYDLRYDPAAGWRIDHASLLSAWNESCRAVLVVNPNNPTGSYLQKDDLEALLSFCAERGMALLSDEVFFDYPSRDPHVPAEARADAVSALDAHMVCDAADRPLMFTLDGFSKKLGLPQMKLGWMVVDGRDALAEAALERLDLIADTYLSVGTPIQHAAEDLFPIGDEIHGQIIDRCAMNLHTLRQAASGRSDMHIPAVHGGWYAIIDIDRDDSEDDIVTTLLQNHNVLVHPGYFFDFPDGCHLVLSLLPDADMFSEGVRRMVEALG